MGSDDPCVTRQQSGSRKITDEDHEFSSRNKTVYLLQLRGAKRG